jgi:hypothetical protein
MVAEPKAKVTVSLLITAVVEVTDEGYLGTQETVAKHIQKAQTEALGWQYLVKKGALEPEPIRAKVKVNSVTIVLSE